MSVGGERKCQALVSIQALKAQAVAARSYALAHYGQTCRPPLASGTPPRWQAYRGLGFGFTGPHGRKRGCRPHDGAHSSLPGGNC